MLQLMTRMPKGWWVNQRRTYAKEIKEHGKVAAVTTSINGGKLQHHEILKEMCPGDIIISNVSGRIVSVGCVISKPHEDPKHLWDGENPSRARPAYVADVDYTKLDPPVPTNNLREKIQSLNIPGGPINSIGNVRQGYAFSFNWDGLNMIKRCQPKAWPKWAECP